MATLTMEEIRRAYPDLRSLVGSYVYVKASVLTASGTRTPGCVLLCVCVSSLCHKIFVKKFEPKIY